MCKRLLWVVKAVISFENWTKDKDLSLSFKSKINSKCVLKISNSENVFVTGILHFIAADAGFNLQSTDH